MVSWGEGDRKISEASMGTTHIPLYGIMGYSSSIFFATVQIIISYLKSVLSYFKNTCSCSCSGGETGNVLKSIKAFSRCFPFWVSVSVMSWTEFVRLATKFARSCATCHFRPAGDTRKIQCQSKKKRKNWTLLGRKSSSIMQVSLYYL